jgi:hypothetical protein
MGKTKKRIGQLLAIIFLAIAVIYILPELKIAKKTAFNEITKADLVKEKLGKIRPYLNLNKYSENLIIIANMSENMSIKRMYVANPSKGKTLHTCLVMHGKGRKSDADKANFSNIPNSLCSSLGKYKISERYPGKFGESYRLDGLDSTNSNARKRAIVFHYYKPQSAAEDIGPHFFSEGCPMLAESDWRIIDELIQKEDKPVLLWMYK